MKKHLQNTTQNNSLPASAQRATEGTSLIQVKNGIPDTISMWIEAYFRFEVTTAEASRKEQRRDLIRFRNFMLEAGGEDRLFWTPRLSRAFKEALQKEGPEGNKPGPALRSFSEGGYSGRTVNRIMAHLKTFTKWIHKLKPFPLGDPWPG